MSCNVFCSFFVFFFFFKQKTAYEMRISDWSSDVCSSDLVQHDQVACDKLAGLFEFGIEATAAIGHPVAIPMAGHSSARTMILPIAGTCVRTSTRSEQSRVGKGGVCTGRSRGSPYH